MQLTVDHVIPVALGGSDDPTNLVSACADCNSGKTSIQPDQPLVADVSAAALKWRDCILAANSVIQNERYWDEYFRGWFKEQWDRWSFGPADDRQRFPLPFDWPATITQLTNARINELDLEEAVNAAMYARLVEPEDKFRYFCGVAWNLSRHKLDLALRAAEGEFEHLMPHTVETVAPPT